MTPAHDEDPRPHLQCDAGQPPTLMDAMWLAACERLIAELLAAETRRAA